MQHVDADPEVERMKKLVQIGRERWTSTQMDKGLEMPDKKTLDLVESLSKQWLHATSERPWAYELARRERSKQNKENSDSGEMGGMAGVYERMHMNFETVLKESKEKKTNN